MFGCCLNKVSGLKQSNDMVINNHPCPPSPEHKTPQPSPAGGAPSGPTRKRSWSLFSSSSPAKTHQRSSSRRCTTLACLFVGAVPSSGFDSGKEDLGTAQRPALSLARWVVGHTTRRPRPRPPPCQTEPHDPGAGDRQTAWDLLACLPRMGNHGLLQHNRARQGQTRQQRWPPACPGLGGEWEPILVQTRGIKDGDWSASPTNLAAQPQNWHSRSQREMCDASLRSKGAAWP